MTPDTEKRIADANADRRLAIIEQGVGALSAEVDGGMVEVSEQLLHDVEWLIELVRASRLDSARLDWFANRAFGIYRQRDPGDGHLYDHFTVVDEDQKRRSRYGCVQPTLRAAIDEAIDAAATPEHAAVSPL